MPRGNKFILVPFLISIVVVLTMIGCGGGAGTNQEVIPADTDGDGDGGNGGKVALYLADAPADDFNHIWIAVSEIALMPCGEGDPEVIFQSDNPEPIDLLELRDGDDLLLTVQEDVAAGEYCKIRLDVDDIEGEGEEGSVDIELPSGKIDLNPRERFDVEADATLSIRLDIDAEKSIHVAGPNYNFRPVVFVDFGDMEEPRPCRHMVKGQIAKLRYAEEEEESEKVLSEEDAEEEPQGGEVIGFRLKLFHGHNAIDVMLHEGTTIFDAEGQSVGPDALAVDQFVGVKGLLESDGSLLADLVVIGSTVKVSGSVETAVDENDTFKLDPAGFAPIFGEEAITVSLSEDTAITMDDVAVDKTQIQPGQKVRVVGKYDADSGTLNAIAIFIKHLAVSGELTAMVDADGGSQLTIRTGRSFPKYGIACEQEGEEREITVILPESVSPKVKGGGTLTIDELAGLIACEHPTVQVLLSQEPTAETSAEALALYVLPRTFDAVTVESIAEEEMVITTTGGETIQVTEETTIWSHDYKSQEPQGLDQIAPGDTLLVTALETCEPTDYLAVTIIKIDPIDPPDKPCPPKHDRVKLTVAEIGEDTITGEEGKIITITEETRFMEFSQGPPEELTLEDIAVGDTLICDVIKQEESEVIEALLITRIGSDDDKPIEPPDWDGCVPKIVKMEVTIETVEDRVITTTEGKTILVPEGTPIIDHSADHKETMDLDALTAGDQIKVVTLTSCEEDDDRLTAQLIVFMTTP